MKRRTEAFEGSNVRFLAEKRGPTELHFTRSIVPILTRTKIEAAYLALVQYGADPTPHVALCLRAGSGSFQDAMREIRVLFADLFASGVHLDFIPITARLERTLRTVCLPFFEIDS